MPFLKKKAGIVQRETVNRALPFTHTRPEFIPNERIGRRGG